MRGWTADFWKTLRCCGFLLAASLCMSVRAAADVPPDQRTADMPDSWLVLYNLNSAESCEWAAWYAQQWGIPAEDLIGLAATVEEHLPDKDTAQTQIIGPVRSLLDNDPVLESRIMGIVVGYRLPGHYATPGGGGPGGYSIPDALEDMYDDGLPVGSIGSGGQQGYNAHDNPQFHGAILPPEGRPTKAWMQPRRYMVARIDGPTLADAKALTLRAKAISDPHHYIVGQYFWYDYTDPYLPNSTWVLMKRAVLNPLLSAVPWTSFDEDTQQTPNDAFRFGTHDVDGWNDARLYSPIHGSRIVAYDYDSWGATTVRSTTADNARFVPNALAAGYAAALGSTAEPSCCLGPYPETIIAALQEGWTLGEAFHLADVWDDWMWTLVGDPLLRVPNWFDVPRPPGDGDMNLDGRVNGLDIPLFMDVLVGVEQNPDVVARADLNNDGVINDDDLFLFGAPSLYGTIDPNVLRGGGDANGDGRVNGADIEAFIDKLINGLQGTESLRERFGPDMNKDGQITFDDLPLFIDALLRQ